MSQKIIKGEHSTMTVIVMIMTVVQQNGSKLHKLEQDRTNQRSVESGARQARSDERGEGGARSNARRSEKQR